MMLNKTDELLQMNTLSGGKMAVAQSFTGNYGLKFKITDIAAFTNFNNLYGEASIHYDGNVTLTCTQVLTGTSTINTGVSSNHLKHAKHQGISCNFYDFGKRWAESTFITR